ncbi:MAG: MFS transporter [Candidatus Acidiferrales bacterium]
MKNYNRSNARNGRWFTRGILGIGLANLFSDWGHEAATSLLPALLALVGAPAIALGVIEGVADGLSSFSKLAGGYIADRPTLRKPVAAGGYVIVGLTTFAYSVAQKWPFILLLRAAGWAGRGAKSPSRDALLADAVPKSQLGRAFGFERAMDTVGAVGGAVNRAAAGVGLEYSHGARMDHRAGRAGVHLLSVAGTGWKVGDNASAVWLFAQFASAFWELSPVPCGRVHAWSR